MFMPNYNMVNRFANTRVNGCNDEQFESMMREASGVMDYSKNNYNSKPRFESCVSEIIDEPDTVTNTNAFGNQQEYNKTMTDNLNNNNFASTRSENEITGNPTNESFKYVDDFREQYTPQYEDQYYIPYRKNRNNKSNKPVHNFESDYMPIHDYTFGNKICFNTSTIVYIVIIAVILLGCAIAIGVMGYKIHHLKEELLLSGNHKFTGGYNQVPVIMAQPSYISTQHTEQPQNIITNQPTSYELAPNRLQMSPMAPVR